jgi:L-aminopeptidase/D-esterase-like protein
MNNTLTDVTGVEVGHSTDAENGTGCTVVLVRGGAVGGVDVRGAAPGTRETDVLRAENNVDRVHGIVLSGGSAYGLSTASGVMRYLEGQGVGHRVGPHIIPIVPAAILFDLGIGSSEVRPGEAQGLAAAEAASTKAVAQGSVGAGTGATVGKALGRGAAMKGGLGSASLDMGSGVVLSALVAVNAVGGVMNPNTGSLIAGPRDEAGVVLDSIAVYADPEYGIRSRMNAPQPLGNTTLAVVATSAVLTRGQANRLATVAQDGLALAIRPCHTLHDGDTVFSLATGVVDAPDEVPRLYALVAAVVARAIVNAVTYATGLHGYPSAREVGSV